MTAPISKLAPTTIPQWLFDLGLYAGVTVSAKEGLHWQKTLRTFHGIVDGYCPECEREVPIKGVPISPDVEEQQNLEKILQHVPIGKPAPSVFPWTDRYFEVRLACNRRGHGMRFYFLSEVSPPDAVRITKIGQHPSLADLSFPNAKRFAHFLGKERYAEYHRGLGLFAHGANIGAFVYLRRIFEHLVEEAHAVEQAAEGWEKGIYERERMPGRIKLLAHRLPQTLVENASMYGVLSVGVHELTEEQCATYFETIHQGIELILSEALANEERHAATARFKAAIAAAAGEVNQR